jgi:siroheme synthase
MAGARPQRDRCLGRCGAGADSADALGRRAKGLLQNGMAPDILATLTENRGMHARRVLRGTLSTIAAEAGGWSTGGPALLLLGEAVGLQVGAGEGNRTLIASLEGWSSTIELHPQQALV